MNRRSMRLRERWKELSVTSKHANVWRRLTWNVIEKEWRRKEVGIDDRDLPAAVAAAPGCSQGLGGEAIGW
jgi:hypothetical protein